jgi:hypothetical protein
MLGFKMFEPKTPYLAVDGVVRLWEGERFKGIVLVERRYEPLGYALPGRLCGGGGDGGKGSPAGSQRRDRA